MSTDALNNFKSNLERLDLYIRFSKSLDLNANEIRTMRTELYLENKGDEMLQISNKLLAENPDLQNNQAEFLKRIVQQQKIDEEKYWEEHILTLYHRLRDELLIIQLVASADAYRTELTELLLRKNADKLKKHKTDIVKLLGDITNPDSWDEIYEEIVRFGVSNLTRRNKYISWIDKIKNEFNLNISANHGDLLQIEEIIATRNILAHNRKIINQDYVDRSKGFYHHIGQTLPTLGDEREIEHTYCIDSIQCFQRVIQAIDNECISMV